MSNHDFEDYDRGYKNEPGPDPDNHAHSHGRDMSQDAPDTPQPEQAQPNPYGPAAPPIDPNSIRCARCGYDLQGLTIGSHCPECGTPVTQLASASGQSNGASVAALVLGIVSIVTCMCYGVPSLICGPLAIFFAKKATVAVQMGQAQPSSLGLANAGKVCGIIGTCLGGLYFLLMVVMFAIQIATGSF